MIDIENSHSSENNKRINYDDKIMIKVGLINPGIIFLMDYKTKNKRIIGSKNKLHVTQRLENKCELTRISKVNEDLKYQNCECLNLVQNTAFFSKEFETQIIKTEQICCLYSKSEKKCLVSAQAMKIRKPGQSEEEEKEDIKILINEIKTKMKEEYEGLKKTNLATTIGVNEIIWAMKNINGFTNIYTLEYFKKELKNLPHSNIDDDIKQMILAKPKGKRISPELYLSKCDINQHLKLFKEGAAKIQSEEYFLKCQIKHCGLIGHPKTGTFVLPLEVAKKAILASNGNSRILENLLGLEEEYLGNSPVLICIKNPINLRIPSGNEAGVMEGFWEPGGYTIGGIPEAITDQIEPKNYWVCKVYNGN